MEVTSTCDGTKLPPTTGLHTRCSTTPAQQAHSKADTLLAVAAVAAMCTYRKLKPTCQSLGESIATSAKHAIFGAVVLPGFKNSRVLPVRREDSAGSRDGPRRPALFLSA